MRELDDREVCQVAGGDIFSAVNIASATRVVTGVSYLGGAFSLGYSIGTALYEGGLDMVIADTFG